MIFKKEDIGMYVALGLTGAGIGLIVGAYIAQRLKRRAADDEYPIEIEVGEEEPIGRVTELVETEDGTTATITVEEVPKGMLFGKTEEPEYSDELKAAIEEHELTAIQIQMVQTGLATLEEVVVLRRKERYAQSAEPYTYSGLYAPSGDEKPDLDELVPDEEKEEKDVIPIDGRYSFVPNVPDGMSDPPWPILYDPIKELFYRLSGRGNLIPIKNPKEKVPWTAWETYILPIMLEGHTTVNVMDTDYDGNEQGVRYMTFKLVPGALEALQEVEDDGPE